MVDGVSYYLLDHHEFFDGLYWGVTAAEKIRRRVAFSRACVEVIAVFNLDPTYTFTNDAYAGIFNGIVKCDHVYRESPHFARNTFLHIIHNGGWQYFDAYHRIDNGFDLFNLFNLPSWTAGDFCDPDHPERLNCMAAGIRFADRAITVSPSYAKQIEYACDGLERILKNVIGISNAIGSDFRSNLTKKFKASRFTVKAHPGPGRACQGGRRAARESWSSGIPRSWTARKPWTQWKTGSGAISSSACRTSSCCRAAAASVSIRTS